MVLANKWQAESASGNDFLAGLMSSIVSKGASAECPICHQGTHRIHSHYERTVADLTWSEYGVSWQLQVRKFFCTNPHCPRRIFTPTLAWGGSTLGQENYSISTTADSYWLASETEMLGKNQLLPRR